MRESIGTQYSQTYINTKCTTEPPFLTIDAAKMSYGAHYIESQIGT